MKAYLQAISDQNPNQHGGHKFTIECEMIDYVRCEGGMRITACSSRPYGTGEKGGSTKETFHTLYVELTPTELQGIVDEAIKRDLVTVASSALVAQAIVILQEALSNMGKSTQS